MNGSHILHDVSLGLGVLPSRSLMLCRSFPSGNSPPLSTVRCELLPSTRVEHPDDIADVEHDMEDGGSLEEWSHTQRHWDASGDGDV